MILVIPVSVVNLIGRSYLDSATSETHLAAFSVVTISGALVVWLFIFGITGLFLRYLEPPVRIIRYITDASIRSKFHGELRQNI